MEFAGTLGAGAFPHLFGLKSCDVMRALDLYSAPCRIFMYFIFGFRTKLYLQRLIKTPPGLEDKAVWSGS